MMERILLYVKHNSRHLWHLIEYINASLFSVFYLSRLESVIHIVIQHYTLMPYSCRILSSVDAESIFDLIYSQKPDDLEFFNPHGFDIRSIRKLFRNKSLLLMGVFYKDLLVGYFFLRFFVNRKCFVGRLIDAKHRGRGIGVLMNNIMYQTSWRMNFRCLSTISRNNHSVMKAHSRNNSMRIIKELENDYMLVEFIKSSE